MCVPFFNNNDDEAPESLRNLIWWFSINHRGFLGNISQIGEEPQQTFGNSKNDWKDIWEQSEWLRSSIQDQV